jgi:hypothetical protein
MSVVGDGQAEARRHLSADPLDARGGDAGPQWAGE